MRALQHRHAPPAQLRGRVGPARGGRAPAAAPPSRSSGVVLASWQPPRRAAPRAAAASSPRAGSGVTDEAAAAVAAAASAAVASNGFVVPAPVVAQLRSAHNLSDDALLLALMPPARAAARPPVSGYQVGAAALGVSGAAYLGANLEFRGSPLSAAVHAEQFAVAVARGAGERALVALATSAAPCGHCRQFLWELPGAPGLRCVTAAAGGTRLAQLLPAAFGPADLLGADAAPLLLQARHNGLQLAPAGGAAAAAAAASADVALVEGVYAALAAANGAHAPYSGCPAGLALLRDDVAPAADVVGRRFAVHAGGAAESAAFNPSLTPLHAAAVAAAAGGAAPDWADVTRAVLVELPGAPVSYADATAAVLRAAAPRCVLTVLPLEGNLSPQWALQPDDLQPPA